MVNAQKAEQAHRDYIESRILSAHPVEIVHMLYGVAMENLNAAISYLKSGDALGRSKAVSKAEEAVQELVLALDHSVGAPFTRTLADLYAYVLEQIIKGHARQSEQAFREALAILSTLSAAWSEVKAKVVPDHVGPTNGPVTAEDVSTRPAVEAADPYSAYNENPSVQVASRNWSG